MPAGTPGEVTGTFPPTVESVSGFQVAAGPVWQAPEREVRSSGGAMRQVRHGFLVSLAALLLVLPVDARGSRPSRKRAPRAPQPPKARPYEVLTPATVRGTCRLSHAMRERIVQYRCVKNPPKSGPSLHALHNATYLTLDGCVVSIEGIRGGKDWPTGMRTKQRSHTIALHRADYAPRVSWVRAGTQLIFAPRGSEDDFNVHGYLRWGTAKPQTIFNFFVPQSAQPMSVGDAFVKYPGEVCMRGDCRPAVIGYVLVFDHPYVAGPTVIDGAYDISKVPPGTYTIRCWHEGLDFREVKRGNTIVYYDYDRPIVLEKQITVEAGKTLVVDWTFDVPAALRAEPK